MSKKRRSNPEEMLNNFDPGIEKLAVERLLSGKQLYDYQTHKLRKHIRDDAQARAILLRAQDLAKHWNKALVLRHFEKRLLARAFETLLGFLLGFSLLSFWADETCDGIPDEWEFYNHNLYEQEVTPFEFSGAVNSNHESYSGTNSPDFFYESVRKPSQFV